MLIGSDFNHKAKLFLIELAQLAGHEAGKNVEVKAVNKNLGFDRKEIKNILEYLENLKLVEVGTIGGPLLYGHISLTEKGLYKSQKK